MAFTVTGRYSSYTGVSSSTSHSPTATTPSANSLLLVGFCTEQDNNSSTSGELSISGGGLTWTDVDEMDGAESVDYGTWGQPYSAAYRLSAGMYRAPVGGSPSSFAPSAAHTIASYFALVGVDVTGHDATTPVVQANGNIASYVENGTLPTLSVTLGSAPTAGNLLVVMAYCTEEDTTPGGISVPSGFTSVYNQAINPCRAACFYRVVQSGDSSTITVSDFSAQAGSTGVGSVALIAVEIAASSGGTNATVTPSTVASTSAVPAPTVTAASNATITPSVVAGVSAVPTPSVSATSDATVTAGTVASTASTPAPSVSATSNVDVTPGTVAAVSAVPAPSVLTGTSAQVSPSVVAAIAAVNSVTVTAESNATATPSTVAAQSSVPSPTIDASTSASVSPATIAAVASVPDAPVSLSAVIGPATVASTAAVPAPSVSDSSNSTAVASTFAAQAAVPAPSVSATSDVDVTAVAVAAVAAVPSPSVLGGQGASVTPSVVAASSSVPSPTVSGGSDTEVTPGSVAAVAGVAAPSVNAGTGATVSPGAVESVVSVPSPAVSGNLWADLFPATVNARAYVGRPRVLATGVYVRLLWAGQPAYGPAYVPPDTLWRVRMPFAPTPVSVLVGHDNSITYKKNPTTADISAAKQALIGGRQYMFPLDGELHTLLSNAGFQFEEVEV